MALIKAGASVRETCINADRRIEEETGKAFKKDKNLQKGKKTFLSYSRGHSQTTLTAEGEWGGHEMSTLLNRFVRFY